jgi:chromate transporter
MSASSSANYSLQQLFLYFLKLGATGFGGPVALVGYMQRDLVEQRKWISLEDFKEGLALSQLAPGPLAAQLAIYLGYVHYRILGATLVGIAFVIPSFIIVLLLGMAYVQFDGLPWMQSMFYGVGAAVIGIIALSAYKLVNKSIGKDWLLWIIFVISGAVTFITETESVWLFLGAGIIYWFVKEPPKFLKKPSNAATFSPFMVILLNFFSIGSPERLWQIALFFTKAGAFVFGSGLAIVPFLYSGTVKEYQWLNEQQFLDAVAVAMITPGPVVITVGFIGYLVEGFWGACVAALATFLPCYFFTIIPAPYFKKYGKEPAIKAFVDGITAAAIGAIAGAVLVLGKRSLTDIYTVLIAIAVAFVLWKFKKIQEPYLIIAAAILGMVIKMFL